MGKKLKFRILWSCFFCSIFVQSCKKQETYDLFPLKVGNEFYYYYAMDRWSPIHAYAYGIETWKVVSESIQGDSIVYTILQTLNGKTIIPGLHDTIEIKDQIYQQNIIQKKFSSLIIFEGFKFYRYQDVSQIDLSIEGGAGMVTRRCVFKADSGMVKSYYRHPPNQIMHITLTLDSIKIIP